jgi:hypothetical protein
VSKKEVYTFNDRKQMLITKNFTPIPLDRITLKVLFRMTRIIVVIEPALDATEFETDYPTTEELVCSALSKERACNSCAKCISHTISLGSVVPCKILSKIVLPP